jgi:hypothetical protein
VRGADHGVETALVRRRVVDTAHLDAAWTALVIRGITIAVLMATTAPPGHRVGRDT